MTTKMIKIEVFARVSYLSQESMPERNIFLWSYEITIHNHSEEIVQLLRRHWRITEMTGHVEEVKGPGVVGLQPIIKPQKSFTYTSLCQLRTPNGTMEGNYEMQSLDEVKFLVQIPKFILSVPAGVVAGDYRSKLH